MRSAVALFRREIYSWLTTPAGYVLGGVYLTISGYFFYNILLVYHEYCRRMAGIPEMQSQLNAMEMVIRPLIMNMGILALLVMPLITMRMLAEERARGTLELLRTSPLTSMQLILAKHLAATSVFTMVLAVTLVYPLILAMVTHLEWGAVLTAWLGLWLLGQIFLAVGIFTSALTESQRVAGLTSFGLLLAFWVASWAGGLTDGVLGSVCKQLAVIPHLHSLSRGILDSRDLAWFVSMTAFFIFLAVQSLESLRWRQ